MEIKKSIFTKLDDIIRSGNGLIVEVHSPMVEISCNSSDIDFKVDGDLIEINLWLATITIDCAAAAEYNIYEKTVQYGQEEDEIEVVEVLAIKKDDMVLEFYGA